MERVVEPESKRIELDVEIHSEKEVAIRRPKREAMRIYRAPRNTLLYAQPISGLAAMVVLLFVPLITLPGLVILVLIAEVYLLDWTYSKVGVLNDARSSISKKSAERSPEDEIDRKIARTSSKDQFIK